MEATNFINTLSGASSGLSHDEYVKLMSDNAGDIDLLEKVVDKLCKIKITKDNFKSVREVKGNIVGLECFMFNNDFSQERQDKLRKIQAKLDSHMVKAARKISRTGATKEIKPLLKYVVWDKWYSNENNIAQEKILRHILDAGLLWKRGGSYFVTGMHLKVGDNVFSYDRNGNEYRCYNNVVVPMAFYIANRYRNLCSKIQNEIPELPECYESFTIVNGIGAKHCAKCSPTRQERHEVCKFIYENS